MAVPIKDAGEVKIANAADSFEFTGKLNLSGRDRDILLSAGLLNYTRQKTR